MIRESLIKLLNDNAVLRSILYPARKVVNYFRSRSVRAATPRIQQLSKQFARDPVLTVGEFDGVFEIDPKSDLFMRLALHGQYESEIVSFIKPLIPCDRDAIDVGANIGFYSVMLAKRLRNNTVLAIEPTSNACGRLKRNLEFNKAESNVIVFQGCASNEEGITEINTILGKEEYSSIKPISHPGARDERIVTERIQTTTIDSLVRREGLKPGFIKIDVEGVEHLVIQGATETISKFRPIVLCELNDFLLKQNGSSSLQVIDLFKLHQYEVQDPRGRTNRPELLNFGDIVCIPTELA
jgi:FkbM family methyltransferase